jgi:uncharacterized protein (UPF0218 family)
MLVFEGQLRERLKIPFGPVYTGEIVHAIFGKKTAACGDYCVRELVEAGKKPDIAVFDYVCMRKPVDAKTRGVLEKNYPEPMLAKNPPGTITREMESALEKAVKEGWGAVQVDGEEDLASLVLMATLPDGWVLVYGQPEKGMVIVEASDRVRENAKAFMAKAKKQ